MGAGHKEGQLPDRVREAIAVVTGGLEVTRDEEGGTDFTVHGMHKPGTGFGLSIGPFSLKVNRSDEGLVVDIYAKGCEDEDEPLTATYAFMDEAVQAIEERYCTCGKPDGTEHTVACEAWSKVKA